MFANWQTTFTGIVGAVILFLIQYLQAGTLDLKTFAIGLVLAILGVLAKDFNTTGNGSGATKAQ